MSAVAKLSSSSFTKFWGASFAESSHSTSGFSPQAIFNQGILSSAPGSLISTYAYFLIRCVFMLMGSLLRSISQHHYSGSFCSGNGGLLQDLMTKATIRSNLSAFAPDVAASHEKGLDYVLGETNSYSCHVSQPQGYPLMCLSCYSC